MLRPDASASATSAAGFESISSRSEAVGVIDPYVDEHGGQGASATGIAMIFGQAEVPTGLDLPCADDPELFFAEAPEDVEAAKALCQGCRAREVCLRARSNGVSRGASGAGNYSCAASWSRASGPGAVPARRPPRS